MGKTNTILGLDVSSRCTGYAVIRRGRWNKSGKSFGTIKPPTKLNLGEKLVYFRDELSKIIKASRPDFIIIEDVFRGPNAKTTKLLSRFSGVAIEVSRRMVKKEPVIAAATKVRSFFELKTKEDAFNFIRQKYKLDWEFSKMNDVADALLLSLYLHKSS